MLIFFKDIVKGKSQKKLSLLMIIACLLILTSFFINFAKLSNSSLNYTNICLLDLLIRFSEKGLIIQLLILLVLYPYTLAIKVLFFSIFQLIKKENKKMKNNTNTIWNKSGIRWSLFLFPLNINLYIYFGQYIIPLKSFSIHFIGIIILSLMLFGFYYYHRQFQIQEYKFLKTIYIILYYSFMNLLAIFMILIILLTHEIKLLLGFYQLFLGSIILFYTLILLKNKKIIQKKY